MQPEMQVAAQSSRSPAKPGCIFRPRSRMLVRKFVIALSVAATLLPIHAAETGEGSLEAAYRSMLGEFDNRGITLGHRHARLRQRYSAAATVLTNLTQSTDEDLRSVFSMSEVMLMTEIAYSKDSPDVYLADMQRVFEELSNRGKATVQERDALIGANLAMWRVEDARRLATRETRLKAQAVPALVRPAGFDAASPATVSISGNEPTAYVRPFVFPNGPVVIVSAGCHIARSAAEDIFSDSSLSDAMRSVNSLWLSPASTSIDLAALRQWNAEFPAAQMRYAYNNASWKEIDFARLPSFHFYLDGKLVRKVTGWNSGSEAKERIWAGLRAIGAVKGEALKSASVGPQEVGAAPPSFEDRGPT